MHSLVPNSHLYLLREGTKSCVRTEELGWTEKSPFSLTKGKVYIIKKASKPNILLYCFMIIKQSLNAETHPRVQS